MTTALYAGQRFTRPRGFGLGRGHYGPKWWLANLDHTGVIHTGGRGDIAVTDTGSEMIEIIEIVPTQVLGTLAYYRRWLVDPDGEEVTISWAPHRKEICDKRETLLRALLARGFTLVEDVGAAIKQMAEPKSFMVH